MDWKLAGNTIPGQIVAAVLGAAAVGIGGYFLTQLAGGWLVHQLGGVTLSDVRSEIAKRPGPAGTKGDPGSQVVNVGKTTIDQAQEIRIGQTDKGILLGSGASEWYKFEVDSPDSPIQILVRNLSGAGPLRLAVFGSDQRQISATQELGADISIRPRGLVPGICYLQVTQEYELPRASVGASLPPYHIQIGDVLDIRLLLNPELNEEVKVRPDGRISTTVAQEIPAFGRTPAELSTALISAYSKDLKNPRVAVVVQSFVLQLGTIHYEISLTR
jgi:hypothetical protein